MLWDIHTACICNIIIKEKEAIDLKEAWKGFNDESLRRN